MNDDEIQKHTVRLVNGLVISLFLSLLVWMLMLMRFRERQPPHISGIFANVSMEFGISGKS
jgi:hypothetical protein